MAFRQIGRQNKLYYNSATHATPTWVLVPNVVDLSLDGTKGEAEQSARSSGFELMGAGLKKLTVSFGYRPKTGADTVFDVISGAYFSDTIKEWFVANDLAATVGTKGLRAYMQCFGLGDEQNLEAGQLHPVTLKPTYFEESSAQIDPDWFVTT